MKLLVLSDIHSNVECLKAIWEKEADADLIYCAGDYVDYGMQPVQALDWVKEHKVLGVMGNHDEHLLNIYAQDQYHTQPPIGYKWVDLNCQDLDEAHIAFLQKFPKTRSFVADGIAYLMAHRCGQGYELIETKEAFDAYWAAHFDIPGCEGMERRMIFGHTHRPESRSFEGGRSWFNPGSASYRRPDNPSKDAFYAVITDGIIEFRQVPYNRKPLADELTRLRSIVSLEEFRVADFFFSWTEEEGPDWPWINYCRQKAAK